MICFVFLLLTSVLVAECRPQIFDEYGYLVRNSQLKHRPLRPEFVKTPLYSSHFFAETPLRQQDDSYVYERSHAADRTPITLVSKPEFTMKVRGPANDESRRRVENSGQNNQRNNGRRTNPVYNNGDIIPQESRILISKGQRVRGPSPQDPMINDQNDFVFPDQHEDSANRKKFQPQPNCGKGMTFCEEADVYPEDYVSTVLSNTATTFRDLLGSDVVAPINITQRIDAMDEIPLCQSREEVVFPKQALSKDDKWLYIVNQDKYQQGVRVEMCLSDAAACQLADGLPLGYTTLCKQKYIYRKMLALDQDGEPYPDSFRLPSCCTCYFKKDAVPLSRFGAKADTSPAKRS